MLTDRPVVHWPGHHMMAGNHPTQYGSRSGIETLLIFSDI
jgi:hypothetical protein